MESSKRAVRGNFTPFTEIRFMGHVERCVMCVRFRSDCNCRARKEYEEYHTWCMHGWVHGAYSNHVTAYVPVW